MPINLGGAMPRQHQEQGPRVNSERGVHDAYWVYQSDPWEDDQYKMTCKLCKGRKELERGDICFACNGKGYKCKTRVTLRYELRNGNVEEESLNFVLTDAGTKMIDGRSTPTSASDLLLRYRAFSGLVSADEIIEWAYRLPDTFRIPCSVIIDLNQSAKALKITSVMPRSVRGAAQPPARTTAPQQQRQAPPPQRQQPPPQSPQHAAQADTSDGWDGEVADDDIPF